MSELHGFIASILLDAEINEPDASSVAQRIVRACFRWRPIEEAPSHYVLDDPRQASFRPAAADGGEIVVKRVGAREYWFRLPPPPEPEDTA